MRRILLNQQKSRKNIIQMINKLNKLSRIIEIDMGILNKETNEIVNSLSKDLEIIQKSFNNSFRRFSYVEGEIINIQYNFIKKEFQVNQTVHKHVILKWERIKLCYRIEKISTDCIGDCKLPVLE